jgi:hypothetical protein
VYLIPKVMKLLGLGLTVRGSGEGGCPVTILESNSTSWKLSTSISGSRLWTIEIDRFHY